MLLLIKTRIITKKEMFETVLKLQDRTDPPKDKKQKNTKKYIKKYQNIRNCKENNEKNNNQRTNRYVKTCHKKNTFITKY